MTKKMFALIAHSPLILAGYIVGLAVACDQVENYFIRQGTNPDAAAAIAGFGIMLPVMGLTAASLVWAFFRWDAKQ
jgi:hypothetical protein